MIDGYAHYSIHKGVAYSTVRFKLFVSGSNLGPVDFFDGSSCFTSSVTVFFLVQTCKASVNCTNPHFSHEESFRTRSLLIAGNLSIIIETVSLIASSCLSVSRDCTQ